MSPGAEAAHDFRAHGTKVIWPGFVGASTGLPDSVQNICILVVNKSEHLLLKANHRGISSWKF